MKFTDDDILNVLKTTGYLSVNALSARLAATPSTVRRRIAALEKEGLLVRTHGGAKIANGKTDSSFVFRVHTNAFEKKLIALKAIKLISSGATVFLDSSTTTYFMSDYLSEFPDLKVITNGIDTLANLSSKGVNVYSTGGAVYKSNPSTLVGDVTVKAINSFHADFAFLSCSSVTEKGVLYDVFDEENVIRREMMKNADKSVLLLDGSKFNRTDTFKLCSINEFYAAVFDRDVSKIFDPSVSVKLIY